MTTKACCDGGLPSKCNGGEPGGKVIELQSFAGKPALPCYEVGEGDKAVIAVYDIFGFTENKRTRLVCDEIARAGYRVILPDFYRGTDVLKEFGTFPPAGGVEAVGEWVTRVAPFDQTVREVNEVVVKHLEGKGAKRCRLWYDYHDPNNPNADTSQGADQEWFLIAEFQVKVLLISISI